ncbi:MAG TPA: class I SAM-dependent methyltransferase [Flavobacteriales bacterium]|nr:class I SAM-dependent methyltransferase [Flavobacteriales bacterium]HMR26538.1 class I SAM-dependent methyltransferase [Flavobacteriales bacterium]
MSPRQAASTTVLLFLLAACDPAAAPPAANTPGSHAPSTATVDNAQWAQEAAWRQPEVLWTLIPNVAGTTVANLFAGDGYYAFELVKAGARVIAIETDAGLVDRIKQHAKGLGLGPDVLEVRLVEQGTGLRPGEADMAFCAKSYLTIPDRIEYFKQVRSALKTPAPLILVDFMAAETPVGPPIQDRISDQAVMDEMELVGCTDIGAYGKKLPYQWVVIAMDFVADPNEVEPAP